MTTKKVVIAGALLLAGWYGWRLWSGSPSAPKVLPKAPRFPLRDPYADEPDHEGCIRIEGGTGPNGETIDGGRWFCGSDPEVNL